MLVIFYGLQNRYKLRDQFGRAHGFRVRANGCARQTANLYSQIHFHTIQRQALLKNQIFKLIQRMKRFFKFFELQIEDFGLASIFKCGIMCFKKCQLAKKLKTSSRTNFLEPCSASIWLTNTPCHNPPNRSDKFF